MFWFFFFFFGQEAWDLNPFDQGIDPPTYWKVKSQPLDQWGSPKFSLKKKTTLLQNTNLSEFEVKLTTRSQN